MGRHRIPVNQVRLRILRLSSRRHIFPSCFADLNPLPLGEMDSSSENPETNNGVINRHWSSDRLRADVHKAVGGTHNLMREVCRISTRLEPPLAYERILKRTQFLAYEFQAVTDMKSSEEARLLQLNHFFFEDKEFHCLPQTECDPATSYLINHVLTRRAGAPILLALLYAFLAESVDIKLDFVDLDPTCFLRWNDNGRSRFIDITRKGRTLTNEELLETLHSRFKMLSLSHTSLLESRAFESFITDYVIALKRTVDPIHEPERMLFLQNTLIAYQPSELPLVGERAFLHRRLGNFKLALADLKRYFAFHDRARAPIDLVRLYDEMLRLLSQDSSGTELND